MPSSPPTPTRLTSASPQSNRRASKRPSISRRPSQYSLPSPSTTRSNFSLDRSGYFDSSYGANCPADPENTVGLANLADELADALDDGDGDDDRLRSGELEGLYDRAEAIHRDQLKENKHPTLKKGIQDVHAISISPDQNASSSVPKHSLCQSAIRQIDGSDYGNDSDLEVTHPPVLEACLAVVESLACQDTEASESDADEIIQRVADSLKDDLGSQTSVENCATRLITAHSALTAHVSYQTRSLSTLTHSLVSPLALPPDPEFIDDLLPLLTSLVRALPATTSHASLSLRNLHKSTSDLTSVLSYLNDTLHMMRQTTSLASRRLRGVRELVIEMRKDREIREEGICWVEGGNWEGRLAGRECARLCGEVLCGFEDVCASWRKRLEVGAA